MDQFIQQQTEKIEVKTTAEAVQMNIPDFAIERIAKFFLPRIQADLQETTNEQTN